VFQANKKILRQKAEEELLQGFTAIFDRKRAIVEATLTIKKKVSNEISKARIVCIA